MISLDFLRLFINDISQLWQNLISAEQFLFDNVLFLLPQFSRFDSKRVLIYLIILSSISLFYFLV